MSNIAIRVEKLSKQYHIGGSDSSYRTFREALIKAFGAPFKKIGSLLRGQAYGVAGMNEAIWALKDISFELRHGEVLGIIGRNGAGKSTLLKILCSITSPTEGYAEIRGRVGSLLEVGTGFHPELTGRENIYLNGAILGMKHVEIKRKFDEIVDFSGVEKFIDTPIKYYSSGMGVRLAFSVAAHLEPEILLIDEVLAVGDFAFQKKCIGKMEGVAKQGRTILFVSHQMEVITNLCSRVILLDGGLITKDGKTEDTVECYLQSARQLTKICVKDRKDRKGDGRFRFTATWIEDKNGVRTTSFKSGDYMVIVGEYQVLDDENVSNLTAAFALYRNGVVITDLSNHCTGDYFHGSIPKKGQLRCVLPCLSLNEGVYTYNMIARSNTAVEDHILDAGYFEIELGDYFGTGRNMQRGHGLFMMEHNWKLISIC